MPGEQLQVVVPAFTGMAAAVASLIDSYDLFGVVQRSTQQVLLVATDRAWLPLLRAKKSRDPILPGQPLAPGPRGIRSVRVSVSMIQRFEGLDQPYSILPLYVDYVRAANDALDAMRAGRTWDLVGCGDLARRSMKEGSRGPLRSMFRLRRS